MRKLVAALACRINGSRLYGKPVQNLDVERGLTVLEHMIACLRTESAIADIVLGVSVGTGNEVFHEIAAKAGILSIRGDERDVLARLIQCGEAAGATDIFRVTTESPFTYLAPIGAAWARHVANGNDATVIDGVPEGSAFEIFTLDALQRSHRLGDARHRSELCSLYIREHRDQFQVEVFPVPVPVQRVDVRLTIDYPEDLVLCRRLYSRLQHQAPRLAVEDIIDIIDRDPELIRIVAPYVKHERLYT
jgi:spore coat polysaccharide biosynthesis protein SpsF